MNGQCYNCTNATFLNFISYFTPDFISYSFNCIFSFPVSIASRRSCVERWFRKLLFGDSHGGIGGVDTCMVSGETSSVFDFLNILINNLLPSLQDTFYHILLNTRHYRTVLHNKSREDLSSFRTDDTPQVHYQQ